MKFNKKVLIAIIVLVLILIGLIVYNRYVNNDVKLAPRQCSGQGACTSNNAGYSKCPGGSEICTCTCNGGSCSWSSGFCPTNTQCTAGQPGFGGCKKKITGVGI